MELAKLIDHTILKPTTTVSEIGKLCDEAVAYGFAAVCVPPPFVSWCAKKLKGSGIAVATVIGFPFGYSVSTAKREELQRAIADAADELDMVINLIAVRAGNWDLVQEEITELSALAHQSGKLIKIIIESGILSEEEIIKCCEICTAASVDYVKTSTGYAEKGASIAAVQLMRANLPSQIKIKASGGIRNFRFASELVAAGADRLGCSASVAIVNEEPESGTDKY